MNKNITFGVVPWFSGDALKCVAIKFLTESWKSAGHKNDDIVDWNDKNGISIIPLFLCETRDDLKRCGALCPHELVIERCDLLPTVNGNGHLTSSPIDVMSMRLRVLKELYGGRSRKNFISYMRDWLAGVFRKYLLLDSTTHGNSAFIDLEKAKDGSDPILRAVAGFSETEEAQRHANLLKRRFDDSTPADLDFDSMIRFKAMVQNLFPEYFDKGTHSLNKIISGRHKKEKKLDMLCKIYCDSEREYDESMHMTVPLEHNKRLPVAFGDRAKYVTPTGKLNLLLIDDNIDASPFAHFSTSKVNEAKFDSSISQSDWQLLRDIFNVQTMPIGGMNNRVKDIYKDAIKCFRKMQEWGLTYDLILVDLCLGNNAQEVDLDGYAMIRIVRIFFPGTPIVIYSRFSDMEHIARAFFNGAKWFLVKGEEAKLPRHVLKLLKQVSWHKEWRTVLTSSNRPDFRFEKDDDFARKFDRKAQWQYLTYKSLEYLQGNYITLRRMGGGISSAVTFKATKGVKLGDDFLQTPSIIKIDASYNTEMEFERYFRLIRPYMANEAGRVEMPARVLNRTYSSIVYTFAGKQDKAHELASMGDMLDDDVSCETACDYKTYRYALKCIFDEILPKIHRVAPELEIGDVGKPSVAPSDIRDAFEWKDDPSRKTSFPNVYLGEFAPTEFWKSYVLRMQPWRRIKVETGTELKDHSLFTQQRSIDIGDYVENSHKPTWTKVSFHNVMPDPFATRENCKDGQVPGRYIIEAYTADKKLVWLEGDVCDFVARFRKRITPGTSLWLEKADWMDEEGNLSAPSNGQSTTDGRIEWLTCTFERNKKDYPTAQSDFCMAIVHLLGAKHMLDNNLRFYTELQDAVIDLAQQIVGKSGSMGKARDWDMKCPVGIIHGDLNVKNVMLESRKHPPKPDDPDLTKTVSDVWLIDFARTRRDIIAHDFNVFFTSVLGELFAEVLIGKDGRGKSARQVNYWEKLTANFRAVVSDAVAPDSKNEKSVPDEIKGDQRLTLIYRILRRTHDAAITAGVSQNMYLLTTSLACLYTLKIFLNNGCKVRLAAGYFATAWICYDLLCKAIDEKNKMEVFNLTP